LEKPAFNQSYANRVLVLFSLLAAFVLYVDIMLTPSLPKIASDYNVTISEVSLAPLFVIVTMLGVGIDYDIFLVTRIREEVVGGKSDHDAIRAALSAE
jgi:RND superfamily putative drug exporter